MHSTADTYRIYNEQDGWYVVMHDSDGKYLINSKDKLIINQHVVGPFLYRHRVEDWLERYLSLHFKNPDSDTFIADSIDTHH